MGISHIGEIMISTVVVIIGMMVGVSMMMLSIVGLVQENRRLEREVKELKQELGE